MTHPIGETREFGFEPGMTVQQAWDLYRTTVYGLVEMDPSQELEVRQAFIASASWTLGAIVASSDGNEEQGIAYLTQLHEEIAAFSQETAERAAARAHLPPHGVRF